MFPPCNTDALQTIPLGTREALVVSVGQYRPEKNHLLQVTCPIDHHEHRRRGHTKPSTLNTKRQQLSAKSRQQVESMAILLKSLPKGKTARLVIVGSCRNAEDVSRAEAVKAKVAELGLEVPNP